ncbi:MAG: hypothetical protein IPJ71_00755 [Bdellovibrionales bacterium]|nr:hypothetical protein [Bdellovibrionales bacterium]
MKFLNQVCIIRIFGLNLSLSLSWCCGPLGSLLGFGLCLFSMQQQSLAQPKQGQAQAQQERPARQLLTTTVAVVGGRPITSREVQIAFLLERAMYGNKKIPESLSLEVKGKEFDREVVASLLEWVVFLEAQSFSAHEILGPELEVAEQRAQETLKKNVQWKGLAVTRSELKSQLERKMRAKRFIQFKGRSSVVPVTDDEVREYFEKNRIKFGNFPFEKFKDDIRSFLERQHVDMRLKNWFEILQEKYKVKNLSLDV